MFRPVKYPACRLHKNAQTAPNSSGVLALTAALSLLRGMLELPAIGWCAEVKATVVIGVVVLPALAGLASAPIVWGNGRSPP